MFALVKNKINIKRIEDDNKNILVRKLILNKINNKKHITKNFKKVFLSPETIIKKIVKNKIKNRKILPFRDKFLFIKKKSANNVDEKTNI